MIYYKFRLITKSIVTQNKIIDCVEKALKDYQTTGNHIWDDDLNEYVEEKIATSLNCSMQDSIVIKDTGAQQITGVYKGDFVTLAEREENRVEFTFYFYGEEVRDFMLKELKHDAPGRLTSGFIEEKPPEGDTLDDIMSEVFDKRGFSVQV